jgi:hypothetical protein
MNPVRSQSILCILCYNVMLDHIAAGVLYLLWKRRRNSDGSLISAKVLRQELVDGAPGTTFRKDLNISAVKAALRKLHAAGMVEYGTSQKEGPDPGPPPKGYRFSAEAPIITWRATAAIVMLLHNHPDRPATHDTVVEEAFKRGLTHHNRDERLTRAEISGLVAYCLRKEYFKEVDVIIDEISAPTRERRLTTTSKVDEYELFLKKIAAEVKRQVASETESSASEKSSQPKAS